MPKTKLTDILIYSQGLLINVLADHLFEAFYLNGMFL